MSELFPKIRALLIRQPIRVACFAAFFLITPLCSQVLLFEQYTIKDGLPSNWITCIYQDSHGYLWVGGDGGLAAYDGVDFKRYGRDEGLPVAHVWTITESRKSPGTLYVGTHGGGLTTYKDGEFSSRQVGTSYAHNVVGHILEDYDGTIWCGTNSGLFTVEKDSVSLFETGARSDQWVAFVEQTRDSLIWISQDRQIYRYVPAEKRVESLNHIFPDSVTYLALLEEDNGIIWIGADDGRIFKIRDDRLLASRKIPTGFPRHILDDRAGSLWLTTINGPARLNKAAFPEGEITQYSQLSGMYHEDVSPGFVDREANLWFGTPSAGLYKLSDRNLVVFPLKNTSALRQNAAAVDENHHIYVGTADGLWEIWGELKSSWKTHLHPRSVLGLDDEIEAISIGTDGRVWLADKNAVRGYTRKTDATAPTEFYPESTLVAGAELHTGGRFGGLIIDRNNQLWYSRTAGSGVSQYDLNTMSLKKLYTRDNGLPGGTVVTMLLDRDGFMWFGEFRGGIAVFKPENDVYVHYRTYQVEDGLGGEQIRSMYQRRNGEIWIGHRYDGITIYKDGVFENLTTRDGLLNNAVWSLCEDAEGRMWLGTSIGIQHTALPSDRTFVTDKRLIRTTTRVLGQIPGQDITYMMNTEDLTLFKLGDDDASQIPTPVNIKTLRVNGTESALGGPMTFTYGDNLYEIEYVGISLKDEALLRFRYTLSNSDVEWSAITNQRTVQFTSLRPDQYRFQVSAINAAGVESAVPAELRFTVLPPIWQRWWFLILATAAASALVFGIHQIRVQRILEVERIRSRIATDLHDDIGAGLTHIGLMSEVTLRKIEQKNGSGPPRSIDGNGIYSELTECVDRVGGIARELSEAMSDVVWSINPKHDVVEALQHRLTAFAYEICNAKDIKLEMHVSGGIARVKLNPEVRRNLLLIAKEALHNAVKYSESPFVSIRIDSSRNSLTLEVCDSGKGFDPTMSQDGNGLVNMRTRAQKMGGTCEIASEPGKGTEVRAVIPFRH